MQRGTAHQVDPRLGTLVAGGQYRVLQRLGQGGFGTVYLVETVVGGLRRALKVLHREWVADEAATRRFVNEALVLEQLNHPNIARCYAAGTLAEGDAPYLLLEFVDGVSLAGLLTAPEGQLAPLPPLRAVRLAKQIASGLVAVHGQQLLHRDLTPQNVLVVAPGDADEQVKLVDFGIAGVLDDRTRSGTATIGTPRYMAPEQLDPGLEVDQRADLWQLGALLHLMLTGRPPYAAGVTIGDLLAQHRRHADAGPSLEVSMPQLHAVPALTQLVRSLLASERGRRPASALEVCEALARVEHALAPAVTRDPVLAMLDALCAHASERGWWAVLRFLSEQPDQARLAAAAAVRLRHWPDPWRRAPLGWWDAAKRGAAPALWPLIRTLDLSGRGLADREATELARNPAMQPITHLVLASNEIGPAGAAALASSEHLAGVVALDLSYNRLGSAGAEHLAGSGTLRALTTLGLADNGLGARAAAALSAGTLRLLDLDLSGNDVGAAGAVAIAASDTLRRLERLLLRDNALGSDGVTALAMSRTLTGLRELDVSGNGVGAGGAAALALAVGLGGLACLRLGRNRLGVEGIELLVASHRFGALAHLDLASNDIGARGAMTLAAAPFVRRLRHLEIGDNALGDAGLAALVGAPYLTGLRRLNLSQNGLTAAGIALLGNAPAELHDLDLSANTLGADGGAALGQVLPRLHVTRLGVSDCALSGEAAASIVAGAAHALRELAIAGNGFGAAGAAALAGRASAARLAGLDVSRNALGADGLAIVARWTGACELSQLVVDGNGLGRSDAHAVVAALEGLPALDDLRLRDNELGGAFLSALCESPVASRMVALDLGFNRLDDAGASILARTSWPSLERLNLEQNDVSLAAAASVWSSPAAPCLHHASCAKNALGGRVDLHSLAQRKVQAVERSFARLSSCMADVAATFYQRLFERYPSLKPLFAHTSMRRQQQHLAAALTLVIDHLRSPDDANEYLRELGARHAGYGAFASHYPAVTGVLVDVLREAAGDDWSDELDSAWLDGLDAVSAAMVAGGRDAASALPRPAQQDS
jgi:hemoglobin-like flavoprotein/tRNA A-37 threonylcarbamoyl transferase component Bud32